MKIPVHLFIAFSLLNIGAIAFAVDIRSENEYYYIEPKTAQDVDRLIFSHAPSNNADGSGMKSVGSYTASIRRPDIHVKRIINRRTGSQRCVVTKVDAQLQGKFMLPKLVPNVHYLDSVRTQFDIASKKIIDHEKKHEQIYADELQGLKSRISGLVQTGASSCQVLLKKAGEDYKQTYLRMRDRNTAFDCREYGNQYDLAKCKNYHAQGMKPQGTSSFSTLQDPAEAGANVQSYKEKPDATACKGKLIEPFKGKFYCVSGDYK